MAAVNSIYTPFTIKDEIRLLVVHASPPGPLITCTLKHARLNTKPEYNALSYVWGPEKEQNTHIVIVNGVEHMVGTNLYSALQHLRSQNEDRILWIDAMCINQANESERGHQVTQMGQIYASAVVVRIWLGLANLDTEKLFSYLQTQHEAPLSHSLEKLYQKELDKLCCREYWGRLWIIQEVVLASKGEVNCGKVSLPWEVFANVVLENPWASDIMRSQPVTNVCRFKRNKSLFRGEGGSRQSLLALVLNHAGAKCVDVRDKIYGLHSLAPECCQFAVNVDYSCSAYELCRRVLKHDLFSHTGDRARQRSQISILIASMHLHRLLIRGALNQEHSDRAFEVGNVSLELHNDLRKIDAKFEVQLEGRICWLSVPLEHMLEESNHFQVPQELLTLFNEYTHPPRSWFTTRSVLNNIVCVETTKRSANSVGNARCGIDVKSNEMFDTITIEPAAENDTLPVQGQGMDLDQSPRGLYELLKTISILVSTRPSLKDSMLFWAQGHQRKDEFLFGLAPAGTRAQDMLCVLRDGTTDHIMVTVRDGDIIGRAGKILGNIVHMRTSLFASFDLPTLQILSRPYDSTFLDLERP